MPAKKFNKLIPHRSVFPNIPYWGWILIGIIALLTAAAIYKSQSRPKGEGVIVEKVGIRTILETVTASGKIFPAKEIKISSDVSGEVVELFVKEGDSVKAGQLLARINPDAFQFAIERSSAGLSAARSQAAASNSNILSAISQRNQVKAQLENAKKIHERNKQLYIEGLVSKADLELSESQLDNLAASLESAQATIDMMRKQSEAARFQVADAEALLKEQRTNLSRTTIKAPAAGIISKLNIEKGERVVGTMQMTGTELMRIADLNAMEVQVEVSENDIVRVLAGNKAEIEVDAYPNRRFRGTVTEVANSAVNVPSAGLQNLSTDQVAKFIVKVRIDKSSYADLLQAGRPAPFKPGMSATVKISTTQADGVLSVPIQAVIAYDPMEEEKKKWENLRKENPNFRQEDMPKAFGANSFREAVFVVKGDTVVRVDVQTGIQDENYIQIISGLSVGDEVVIGPYVALSKKLKSGSTVHRKRGEDDRDNNSD